MKPSLLLLLCSILFSLPLCALPPGEYAIRDVSVIPMNEEVVLDHQTVLIENGIIRSVGPESQVKVPAGYSVIDGTGKYLMPGLFDMHAHFYYEQGENVNTCEEELKVMLANGLTTVRIECGDPVYLDARKNVQDRTWAGPELMVSSPQFVGKWPWPGRIFGAICTTPEQGAEAVKRFKKEGYDEIKITFMVTRDVYDAVVKTAREEHIKVTGHVGPLVKLPAALAAHQQIEHMDEFIDMLLPDTSYNHGQSVSDMNVWRKKAWETVPFLDEQKIPALVRQVKDANIFVTPTNYFFFSFFGRGIDEEKAKQAPGYAYIPDLMKREATEIRQHYFNMLPPEASRKKYIDLRKAITYQLWKAGVKLMAGSDSPQWYSATGFTLHDELETFVACGLSPYAALQTATVNPATYSGRINNVGTIAPGKEARLVLLEKNPLEDIRNTRSIAGVFSGTWYDRIQLNALLTEARSLGR